MSNTGETPYAYEPGAYQQDGLMAGKAAPSGAGSGAGSLVAAVGALVGSVLIGVLGGLIWNAVAPKAVYVVVSHGSADVVNAETSAFITADFWFCLIGVIGGLIIGVASYPLAVRKYGPVPMLAVLAGSIIAGLAARWVGQDLGLAQFNDKLLTSHLGAVLHAPPVLGAVPSVIVWPAITFWPLAACVVPAAGVLIAALRDRPARRQPQLPQLPQLPHPGDSL
jgi:hypothetical protein